MALTPLAVDLDGTLIHGDVSAAAFWALARARPLSAMGLGPRALWARAGFKRDLAMAGGPPAMAFRTAFVAWLAEQRGQGRSLHLITGADQRFAEAIAAPLGLFDSIEGSDGVVNLVGAAKAARLRARFADGFSYAGDSIKDVPVFAAARSIVLVGASARVVRAAERLGVAIDGRFK